MNLVKIKYLSDDNIGTIISENKEKCLVKLSNGDIHTCEMKNLEYLKDSMIKLDKTNFFTKGVFYPNSWEFYLKQVDDAVLSKMAEIEASEDNALGLIEDLLNKTLLILDNEKPIDVFNIIDIDISSIIIPTVCNSALDDSYKELQELCPKCENTITTSMVGKTFLLDETEKPNAILNCYSEIDKAYIVNDKYKISLASVHFANLVSELIEKMEDPENSDIFNNLHIVRFLEKHFNIQTSNDIEIALNEIATYSDDEINELNSIVNKIGNYFYTIITDVDCKHCGERVAMNFNFNSNP